MHIAVSRMDFRIPQSHSLKDKRRVARSLTARIRAQFNVAVAEEPDDTLRQRLTLVVCCIGGNADYCQRMLDSVADFVAETRPDLELLGQSTEVLSGV